MKAVIITHPGTPEVLQIAERPIPICVPGEVMVKVAAAGVNRPDVSQRKGTIRLLRTRRKIHPVWK